MKNKWIIFLGPSCFASLLLVLLLKTATLVHHPVWMSCLFFSILLSLWISYLCYEELKQKHQLLQAQIEKNLKQSLDLRGVLDETNQLYREKVEKLEVTIAEIEASDREELDEKSEALTDLQKGYRLLHEKAQRRKNQASALQTSLDDALDLVRELRQREYLQKESKTYVPHDLVHKHKQLREQFADKADALNQTRVDLFRVEGELDSLKKDWENIHQEESMQQLTDLFLENEGLKAEILSLEQLISKLLEKKPKKSKKQLEEMLELQLDLTKSNS